MSHKSQLVKNTVIIAIGKLSTQILSYLMLPFYTDKVSPEEYGTYDFLCTVSLFLCPIITLLMEESMFRFLIDAETKAQKKKIISQTIIYTIIGTLVFIPIAAIVLNICTKYSPLLIFAFIAFVVSNIAIALSNSLARGLSQIKMYSVSNFILGALTIVFTLIVVFTKPDAVGLLFANLIANFAVAFYIFKKLKLTRYIGKRNNRLMKKMVKYSIPLVPNSISWSIINMSDRIILTATPSAGSVANGIYAMANRFPNIINVLYGYFYTAWKETASKIIKEKNKEKFYNSIYHDMKRLLYSVTICLISAMPFAFPLFIHGEGYEDAFVYIPIIMIATYYSNLSSFYGGIFSAYKNTKIMGTTTFVAAIINLVIDIMFVEKYGIYAACFSTLIADLIVYFYRKVKLKRYMNLKEVKFIGPALILILVCIAYYIKYFIEIDNTIYLLINALSLLIAIAYSIAINYKYLQSTMIKIREKLNSRKTVK